MKEIFLLKLGEIVLKGANKRQFESRLRQNVRRRMKAYGSEKIGWLLWIGVGGIVIFGAMSFVSVLQSIGGNIV